MNGKISIFGLGLLIALAAALAAAQSNPPLLTFNDLQKYDSKNATFRIEAYVFDIYKCPPCPPGMMCKPCIPNNLTVVDRIDEKNTSAMKQLRILTDDTAKFTRTEKYLFTVHVKSRLDEGKPVFEVELVSFEKVKPKKN
ncbi:MAG: hypothetical protein JSS81_19120 [Acidobacteria bacterium]|nr:hypothetical protein [Acidobacteriota bacterium]